MGNTHSSNSSNKQSDNNKNDNINDINDNYNDIDGGELPVEYFYEYRERDRSNLDRTILLEIFNESFGSIRHQVKANTTLKKVKEIIDNYIPINPNNYYLEIANNTNYDENKTVNDFLFKECDVVMIKIHDSTPKFQILFDFTDIKDSFKDLQENSLEFRPYDRLIQAYKDVSKLLHISSYRYTLKFNEITIPYTDEIQLQKHFVDANLNNGSSVIKIENLNLPPPPEKGYEVFIRYYGKKEVFKASRKNIVDDIIFANILSNADKENIYFILKANGKLLKRNETFGKQGVATDQSIEAIIKLHKGHK